MPKRKTRERLKTAGGAAAASDARILATARRCLKRRFERGRHATDFNTGYVPAGMEILDPDNNKHEIREVVSACMVFYTCAATFQWTVL